MRASSIAAAGCRARSDRVTSAAHMSGRDWKSTLLLPKTEFPMRADLPKREPARLARWQDGDLYGRIRAARQGAPRFLLHDGPPYANGRIHMGTAMNKLLKDLVVRSTALAEAEIEYEDKTDWSIYVAMPLEKDSSKGAWPNLVEAAGAPRLYALIWTTTPWTLPANRAIALGTKIEYVFLRRESEPGAAYLVADALVPQVTAALGWT